MEITNEQRVQVAKDRAVDELTDMVDSAMGYFNLRVDERERVRAIGQFLSRVDRHPRTLAEAERLGFINGEEEIFFGGGF